MNCSLFSYKSYSYNVVLVTGVISGRQYCIQIVIVSFLCYRALYLLTEILLDHYISIVFKQCLRISVLMEWELLHLASEVTAILPVSP